ncbi:MAG TPA: hypothetical protein VFX22_03335 [Candidatus Kapabacteria bacterium]|nr:hypothetical protein [Candidatus Kapabacteria bacterium]
MDKRTDSLPLLDPLREVVPGISLDELQQFLANAPAKQSAAVRFSITAIAALAIVAGALIFGFHHSIDTTVSTKIVASVSPQKQALAGLELSEKLEHSITVAHSNHLRAHLVHIHVMALAETANIPTTACASAAETSSKPLPSSDFMNPVLLCSAVTAPQTSDFGSNTTILPPIGSNIIPSSTHFYEK